MDRTRWPEYLTRGLLAFIFFLNLGTALRCFFDDDFLSSKMFSTPPGKDGLVAHLFGVYSAINALIYVQAAIHIFTSSTTQLAFFASTIYTTWFAFEAFGSKTIRIRQSAFFPFFATAFLMIWLVVYLYLWRPFENRGVEEKFLSKPWMVRPPKPTKSRSQSRCNAHLAENPEWINLLTKAPVIKLD